MPASPSTKDRVGEDRTEELPIGLETVHLERAQRPREAPDRRHAARPHAP